MVWIEYFNECTVEIVILTCFLCFDGDSLGHMLKTSWQGSIGQAFQSYSPDLSHVENSLILPQILTDCRKQTNSFESDYF